MDYAEVETGIFQQRDHGRQTHPHGLHHVHWHVFTHVRQKIFVEAYRPVPGTCVPHTSVVVDQETVVPHVVDIFVLLGEVASQDTSQKIQNHINKRTFLEVEVLEQMMKRFEAEVGPGVRLEKIP